MYEVWDEDRIIYISNNYSRALDFWISKDHEAKGYIVCFQSEYFYLK